MSLNRHPHGRFSWLHATRIFRLFAGLAALVFVVGCATGPMQLSGSATIEDKVKERAAKRWEALIVGDIDAAYGYFSKATKNTYPLEMYRSRIRPGLWREARVDTVKCSEEVCEVTVIVTVDHARIKGLITPVAERWIIQDGQAWYVYNG